MDPLLFPDDDIDLFSATGTTLKNDFLNAPDSSILDNFTFNRNDPSFLSLRNANYTTDENSDSNDFSDSSSSLSSSNDSRESLHTALSSPLSSPKHQNYSNDYTTTNNESIFEEMFHSDKLQNTEEAQSNMNGKLQIRSIRQAAMTLDDSMSPCSPTSVSSFSSHSSPLPKVLAASGVHSKLTAIAPSPQKNSKLKGKRGPKPQNDCMSKRERNKLSASKYRKRRKQYFDGLEAANQKLEATITLQQEKISSLHNENELLKEQVVFLRKLLSTENKNKDTWSSEPHGRHQSAIKSSVAAAVSPMLPSSNASIGEELTPSITIPGDFPLSLSSGAISPASIHSKDSIITTASTTATPPFRSINHNHDHNHSHRHSHNHRHSAHPVSPASFLSISPVSRSVPKGSDAETEEEEDNNNNNNNNRNPIVFSSGPFSSIPSFMVTPSSSSKKRKLSHRGSGSSFLSEVDIDTVRQQQQQHQEHPYRPSITAPVIEHVEPVDAHGTHDSHHTGLVMFALFSCFIFFGDMLDSYELDTGHPVPCQPTGRVLLWEVDDSRGLGFIELMLRFYMFVSSSAMLLIYEPMELFRYYSSDHHHHHHVQSLVTMTSKCLPLCVMLVAVCAAHRGWRRFVKGR